MFKAQSDLIAQFVGVTLVDGLGGEQKAVVIHCVCAIRTIGVAVRRHLYQARSI